MNKQFSILVVDDNPINIKVLVANLTNEKFKILTATNGNKALAIVDKTVPDIILLDINMPGLNGYETCKKLQQSEKTKHIPVIFLSALNEIENKVMGYEIGAVDYITKPFQREEVIARVNTHLEISELKKKLNQDSTEFKNALNVLSHDIQNQIMIINMSTFLTMNTDRNTNPKYDDHLSLILKSAESISTLMNKVYKISRFGTFKDGINLKLYKVSLIKSFIDKIFTEKLKSRHISINYDIDDINIMVNPDLFTKVVISNLISNAIKYSYADSSITFSAKEKTNNYEIRIKDTGIGMTEEQCQNLFSTPKEPKTSFSLPLVKHVTEAMNGSIHFESHATNNKYGLHGTEYILSFPK
jgi:two-component system, sensor histidine kinase and response regulator